MKTSDPGLLFAGSFLITDLISILVIGLFRLSISSWFSFGKLYVSRNFSISSKLPICWHITVHSILLWLYLCIIDCDFSSFISYFVYLVLSLFFLMSQTKGLSILYFPKNQLLVSLIFSTVFFLFLFSLLLLWPLLFPSSSGHQHPTPTLPPHNQSVPKFCQSTSLALSVTITSAPSNHSSIQPSTQPCFFPSLLILFLSSLLTSLSSAIPFFSPSTLTIGPYFWKGMWPCQGLWPLDLKDLKGKSQTPLCALATYFAFRSPLLYLPFSHKTLPRAQPTLWKIVMLGIRFLVDTFFFFQHFECIISLPTIVSDDVLLYMMDCFFLLLQRFSNFFHHNPQQKKYYI